MAELLLARHAEIALAICIAWFSISLLPIAAGVERACDVVTADSGTQELHEDPFSRVLFGAQTIDSEVK